MASLKTIALPLVLCLVFIFSLPEPGLCDLQLHLKKYRYTSIPSSSLEKISYYDHLIYYYSNISFFHPDHKVSPDFIRALILAESACNPNAVSEKKAFGLAQILLSTGREAALELFRTNVPFRYINRERLKNIQEEDLFDPAINILLTCYLISKYNYKFNGKLELVLTAWNAGVNTENLNFGLPAPYDETQDLIGKVNGYFLYLLDQNKGYGRRYSYN
jgi:soluble lytic murein transglycosylase-like protein